MITRRLIYAIAVVCSLSALLVVALKSRPQYGCTYPHRSDRRLVVGNSIVAVEVVGRLGDLRKGLAGRACISPGQGMLFEFPRSGDYRFVTSGMRFPVDIVWLDTGYRVVSVQSHASPSSRRVFRSERSAQYVLELDAGHAAESGLAIGSAIKPATEEHSR
jgi:hypothetical protein